MNLQTVKQITNDGYLMRFLIITVIFTTSFGAIIHGVQKKAKGDQGKRVHLEPSFFQDRPSTF